MPLGGRFPKPTRNTIGSAVVGFGGDFHAGPKTGLQYLPRISIDPSGRASSGAYLYAGRIDKLGMSFKSFREPLTKALNQVIIPSIHKNFDAQGRPKWKELKKSTIRRRLMDGYPRGPILYRSGRLRRGATKKNIWYIGPLSTGARSGGSDILRVKTEYFSQLVPYARYHQKGARVPTTRRTGKLKTTIERVPGGGFEAFGGESREWTEGGPGAEFGKLVPRPFIQLTTEEEIEIYNIFVAFMVEKVDKSWGTGSEGL